MTCAKCGDCCAVIMLKVTKADIEKCSGPDRDFIMQHWTEISRKEANRLAPGLVKLCRGNPHVFYSCDKWDSESRLCTAHDERPPVCQGFPWYDREPNGFALLPYRRCSFWHEVPREQWPDGVQPLESP